VAAALVERSAARLARHCGRADPQQRWAGRQGWAAAAAGGQQPHAQPPPPSRIHHPTPCPAAARRLCCSAVMSAFYVWSLVAGPVPKTAEVKLQ
jgi:hypothetical protein